MDDLSNDQYESILKYMEVANEDDFTKASDFMAKHAYNIQNAINERSIGQTNTARSGQLNEHYNEEQQIQLQRNLHNYVNYLRNRNQPTNLIKNICGQMKFKLKKLCSSCSKITLPFLHQRFFGKQFKTIYRLPLSLKVSTQLQDSLNTSKTSSKPCLVILSSSTINSCLLEFMRNQTNANQINKYFQIVGLVQGSLDAVAHEEIMNQQPPSLIFCRKDITKRLNIFRTYRSQTEIMAFSLKDIQEIVKQFQRLQRKDVNVVRRFNHRANLRFNRLAYPNQFHADEDQYQLQQNQGLHSTQRSQTLATSSMIQQQNQVYKQIEKQAMKKRLREEEFAKKLEQENLKHQQVQQERKLRKMSIPDQPTQGQIVRLTFRCPDGQTIKRNFLMDQQLQLVYNWVQTNEEIEFENNKSRDFQLLAFYPPVSLKNRKSELLKAVFEDGQQKIMIREI